MSKKGLLNEATVRRFMGLAGMEAKIVSNTLQEMYHKKEDDEKKMEENVDEMKYKRDDENVKKEAMYSEAEPAADEEKKMEGMYKEEEPNADKEMPPAMDDDDEMGMDDAEVELSPEDIGKLKALKDAAMEAAQVVDMLDDAAAGEEAGESDAEVPELDDAGDADMDAPEEDEEVMEALSGINLELNEDELVQEVAKRVARRLLRAKKAQAQLDEALGRKRRTK